MESDSNLILKTLNDPRLQNMKKEILDATYNEISNEAVEELIKNKDKDKSTGLYFCRGSIAYACPYPDPYHLKNPNDTVCDASKKLWKKFRLLLSLKWEERKKKSVAHLPLDTLINSTNWHVGDDYMMGISEIATSEQYIPFEINAWYKKPFEHVCAGCFKVVPYFENAKDRTCSQCNRKDNQQGQQTGLPSLAHKLFPVITSLPSRFHNLPDVEAYIFPVTRMSNREAIPPEYFDSVMKFVADLSRLGQIPKTYFKMSNTAGSGSGRSTHYAMTQCCTKQSLDVTGSTQGIYQPIASLLHRIVYVYREKKFIYLAMNHPSNFLLHPLSLVNFLEDVASYGVNLSQLFFLYYGLDLNAVTIDGYRQISGREVLDALRAKMPIYKESSGISGILFSMMEQFDERENHGAQKMKGRHAKKM